MLDAVADALTKARTDYADQLLKYADAVVGIAFLQGLAFCYKLSEKDFALRITTVPKVVLSCIFAGTLLYIAIAWWLYTRQLLLMPNAYDPTLMRIRMLVQFGRYCLIILTGAAACAAFLFTKKYH